MTQNYFKKICSEAAIRVFCVKKLCKKFHKIHKKTPVPESLLQ